MNGWRVLGGCCLASVTLFFASIGGWIWARDDFFPLQLTLSAPPQSANRVAVISDSDMQGDSNHSMGVSAGKSWQKWAVTGTQSEFADQKWQLIWSRDGSLVALRQSPGMLSDPRIKSAQFTHAFDFSKRKAHQSSDSPGQNGWSKRIESLLQARGGAVAGGEIKRDLGVWRWEDRDLKDAL
jgi:hypothetical protein